MSTLLSIVLIALGCLAVFFFAILIILGSPSAREPRIIKALRFNMVSEMLGMIGHGLLHPRMLAYRATKAEKKMRLPGDDIVPTANAVSTYAIPIQASPEEIWPWLIQMGYGRAIWYAWSPAHAFPEYKHHISTYTIHPEWQSLKVGDILLDGDALEQCNETKGAWRVIEIQERRAIVFYSARDFIEGIEFDPQTTRPKQIYGITSWVFYIQPMGEEQSRLLIRVRAELGPGLFKILAWLIFGLGDAVFERTILTGIKERVEQTTALSWDKRTACNL